MPDSCTLNKQTRVFIEAHVEQSTLERNITQLLEGAAGPLLRNLFMRGAKEGGEFHAHIEYPNTADGLCLRVSRKGYRLARCTRLSEAP